MTPAPDLDALALLVSVAETGSIGRAAARHDLTQPAVSLRLRALERQLRLVLLERSPSGSRLTAPGRTVVDWARPLLDAADAFDHSVSALADRHHDRLRLAASLTVADHLVPGWLVALHAALPDVAVSLQAVNSEHVAELVRAGDVDLGYVEGPGVPAGLRSRPVGGDELVTVTAPGHPWARRRAPVSPEELAAAPLVVREIGSGTREALASALAAHGLPLRTGLELGSTAAIKAAVMAGDGVAVLSRLAVATDLEAGRLVAIAVAKLDLRRQFHAVWRAGRAPTGPANSLLALSLRS